MSDRAIARELGVSQPFVSGLLRQTDLARWTRQGEAADYPEQPIETVATSARASQRPSDRDVRGEASALVADERTTSPQEWLDRYHDEHSLLGRVRRVGRSVGDDDDDVSHALRDGDPFACHVSPSSSRKRRHGENV